jgi:hypothetical protein
MSAAAVIGVPGDLRSLGRFVLPCVWAFSVGPTLPEAPAPRPPEPNLAFYRKYTVALLARYVRTSMEAGKVRSPLGREMLRGKADCIQLESFEDAVIFLHDIDHCLEKLTPDQEHLVTRITLQQFTVGEVSAALGVDPRTLIRRHTRALDRLTRIFLDVKILTPPKHCQGGKS